jgi:DNA-binding NtrC family response regulator
MARGSILIVDDEEAVRVTLGAILSEVGHTVTLAAGLGDALVLLIDTEFDVVLTDLRLDDGDGLAIIEQTRRHWPDTVTLILTGYASVDSAIGAIRRGAYDYLCKPCPPEELIATIARCIERRQLTLQVRQQLRDLQTAITVARDLHASLSTQLEATTALLRERELSLASLSAELVRLRTETDGLVQRVNAALCGAADLRLLGRHSQYGNSATAVG